MRYRKAAAAALALAAAACRHPTRVGPAGAESAGQEREEPTPAQKGVPPRGEHPRVPASPKALLAEGEVAKIQDALAQRGYLAKHEPGELDHATTAAIRRFQKDRSLAETGFPDRLTLRMLGLDPEAAYSRVREGKDEAAGKGSGAGSGGTGETRSGKQ